MDYVVKGSSNHSPVSERVTISLQYIICCRQTEGLEDSSFQVFHRLHSYVNFLLCTEMDFDEILDSVGQFGRYQKTKYLLVCFVWIVCGMQMYASVFTIETPQHRYAVLHVLVTEQRPFAYDSLL